MRAEVVVLVIRRLRLSKLDSMLPWFYWSVAIHLISWKLLAKMNPEYVFHRWLLFGSFSRNSIIPVVRSWCVMIIDSKKGMPKIISFVSSSTYQLIFAVYFPFFTLTSTISLLSATLPFANRNATEFTFRVFNLLSSTNLFDMISAEHPLSIRAVRIFPSTSSCTLILLDGVRGCTADNAAILTFGFLEALLLIT